MPSVFQSGARVPYSGIYLALHAQQHAETHYVTAVCGDVFPSCLECLDQVEFQLALRAAHVSVHPNFKEAPLAEL